MRLSVTLWIMGLIILAAVSGCSSNTTASNGFPAGTDQTDRTVSVVGEIDGVYSPVAGPPTQYTGNFSASVDAGITGGDAPHVVYQMRPGSGSWVTYGTGWDPGNNFAATISPPDNYEGFMQFRAVLWAYDDNPPYGPYNLDTVQFNIYIDTL